jgi:hypothetical protein
MNSYYSILIFCASFLMQFNFILDNYGYSNVCQYVIRWETSVKQYVYENYRRICQTISIFAG